MTALPPNIMLPVKYSYKSTKNARKMRNKVSLEDRVKDEKNEFFIASSSRQTRVSLLVK